MALTAGLSLLTLLALQAAAQEPLYVEIGKNLNLDPKSSEAINAITWKHKGNIAAEYIKDAVPLEYLGDLKGRLKLDVTTGILTISNITKSDDGQFTVEVNNRVLPVKFNVVGVRKLVTVEVNNRVLPVRFNVVGVRKLDDYPVQITVRPQGCSSLTSRKCTLVCGGTFEGAEPVQYFWKKGKTGQWKEGGKTISISITKKTSSFPRYTCKVKNLFSEKESDPKANPFKKEPSSGPVPLPAVLLVAVLAIGAAVIV
uniref:Ig-like domain-containing protein n=1 Tax=Xiphophorus maculatus TaxID=8083 RepID=A0A3B5RB69_XIPMA